MFEEELNIVRLVYGYLKGGNRGGLHESRSADGKVEVNLSRLN